MLTYSYSRHSPSAPQMLVKNWVMEYITARWWKDCTYNIWCTVHPCKEVHTCCVSRVCHECCQGGVRTVVSSVKLWGGWRVQFSFYIQEYEFNHTSWSGVPCWTVSSCEKCISVYLTSYIFSTSSICISFCCVQCSTSGCVYHTCICICHHSLTINTRHACISMLDIPFIWVSLWNNRSVMLGHSIGRSVHRLDVYIQWNSTTLQWQFVQVCIHINTYCSLTVG